MRNHARFDLLMFSELPWIYEFSRVAVPAYISKVFHRTEAIRVRPEAVPVIDAGGFPESVRTDAGMHTIPVTRCGDQPSIR